MAGKPKPDKRREEEADEKDIAPHPYVPGQIRKRRTVCDLCMRNDTDPIHNPEGT